MESTSSNFVGGWTVTLANAMFLGMLMWIFFLMFDYCKHTKKPSFMTLALLLCHIWLAGLFLVTAMIAENHDDSLLVWFHFLIVFRYYKTVVLGFFYFRYKLAVAPRGFALSSADVTVIVPTVGANGNAMFNEMASSILWNKPQRLIFSTVTENAKKSVEAVLVGIKADLENRTSAYLIENNLPPLKISTEISVISAHVASKREQFIRPLRQVDTLFVASADDTVVWNPDFLPACLPAFSDEGTGLVGTHKEVKRLPCPAPDPSRSWFINAWNAYCFGFWNAIGATYLIRHNFEARASNAADGGIFSVSGRTFLVRSQIVQDKVFQEVFLHEIILPWLPGGGVGPIYADDDNFLTRWVTTHGWKIKFQDSEQATVTTVLGKDGGRRFKDQCLRWSRITMRQNPQTLFIDRTAWWRHPVTVWTTYFPWLYNAALIWDTLMVGTLYCSKYYHESEHRVALMAGLIGLIWVTKLIKTVPWFWKHPQDFFRYFFPIPVWALFIYGHSVLKIYTAFTFWDLEWTGRKLPTVTEAEEKNKK